MPKVILTAFFTFFLSLNAFATPEFVPGNLIIRLDMGTKGARLIEFSQRYKLQVDRVLSPTLNMYLARVLRNESLESALERLTMVPQVIYAQRDHYVSMRGFMGKSMGASLRATPNDPQFSQQWGVNSQYDINAMAAWDYGTGGKDASGNDIVVAVVDRGVELTHSDLVDNLWVNGQEIPGNGVDDDKNGYIDDINGWNAYGNNGSIPANYHGTHVAGIIGAKGNNNLQVSGVNWDIKIMAIAGSSGITSTVMTAYGYALVQKQLWINSNGQQGANVTATNSSFGIDRADCTSGDYPAWNDMYTALGEVGILSAAATMNANLNVDDTGDVPTGCTSPYLITVTNTTNQGMRYSDAAYGLEAVDLGAPGTGILSTYTGNSSGNLTGTSMATPHIAGAVAFLHSVASKDFNQLYLKKPGQGALLLKQILLETVTPQNDLNGITVTGGRLNLFAATKTISAYTLAER